MDDNQQQELDEYLAASVASDFDNIKNVAQLDAMLHDLHSRLGHSSSQSMATMLKKAGASPVVVDAALELKRPACEALRMQPAVRHGAGNLVPEPLETIGTDGLEWKHPHIGHNHKMTLIADEASGLTQVYLHAGLQGNRSA